MRFPLRARRRGARRGAPLLTLALSFAAVPAFALGVRGVVTDQLNRPIANAVVALVDNGKIIVSARTAEDGSYALNTSAKGRFYVLATGQNFRQLRTESFYGAAFGTVEKNITLEPDTIRQAIVVTATGTPVPQAQLSTAVTDLNRTDLESFQTVIGALRLVPGYVVAQSGEQGSVASLFIRGGNSDDNTVLLDGVPIEDTGGVFDFSDFATTGVAGVEAARGPNSVVWGADAGAGVVDLKTIRGSTPFPSFFYEGDGGNFGTYRNEAQVGGTRNRFDYYAAFGDFQTRNSVAKDSYHNITSVANIGYALGTRTSLRVIAHNNDAAVGSPGQYAFTRTPTDQRQGDQDIYLSGTVDHSFSARWQAEAVYGLARKREQFEQYAPTGTIDPATGNFLGHAVTVTGANGYTVQGQTITSYAGSDSYLSESASNRDSIRGQTSYAFTPHLLGVAGFRWENERGLYPAFYGPSTLDRTNYDYTLAIQGDAFHRFFYTLGGGVEKNGLFGTVGAPQLGASYYMVRPGAGMAHGTRVSFNFSKGYKEPTLPQQQGSLYTFLEANGGSTVIHQYQVQPIGAALTRSYDGGVEQSLLSEKALFKAHYFHNEFGNQIESVGAGAVPQLLPNLTAAQQASLAAYLQANGAYGVDLNSLSFRAQGVETEFQASPLPNWFLRAGYTYLDAVVQRSFSSDALAPSSNPDFPGILIGNDSPLRGGRPFRRPPHTGFASITYTSKKWTGEVSSTFAGRADDSTYLGGADASYGNSLLLPNRDLEFGYAAINADGAYQVSPRIGIYTQLENLTSQQHISPIGYLSQPFTFRSGLRVTLGRTVK